MGRAKSNTKRRPKGKRGWRKIETDAFLKPPQFVSVKEERIRIEKLKNSQLWKQDLSPQRRTKKLSKAQKKLKAKRKLLSRGCVISSIESNNKMNSSIAAYKKQRRLSTFKWTQSNQSTPAPPKSATIKFSNKTKKKIHLNTPKQNTLDKKNKLKNTDYHKNDHYLLYKVKHSKKNKQNMQAKDLWAQPAKKKSESLKIEKKSKSGEDLPDVRAVDVIKAQKKASGSYLSGGRAVQNKFAPVQNLISLPNPGESINPLQFQYYFLRWKALELRYRQLLEKKYQSSRATEKWYKTTLSKEGDEDEDKFMNKLKASLVLFFPSFPFIFFGILRIFDEVIGVQCCIFFIFCAICHCFDHLICTLFAFAFHCFKYCQKYPFCKCLYCQMRNIEQDRF